jgi:hypothetical protein
MTGPLQFSRVRLCYKVVKSCIVMLFNQHHLATLFVINATMLPTQHVIICQVLVENYASYHNETEVLDIYKISTVMFFS